MNTHYSPPVPILEIDSISQEDPPFEYHRRKALASLSFGSISNSVDCTQLSDLPVRKARKSVKLMATDYPVWVDYIL